MSFDNHIMYVILTIAIAGIVASWFDLRRYTRIWIQRPISASESLISGLFAWLMLFSILAWLGAIIFISLESLNSTRILDFTTPIFLIIITGYSIYFLQRSRTDLQLDEIADFWKEAIQFRRSAQRRIDVLTLLRQDQNRRNKKNKNDALSLERRHLQTSLNKEKETEKQLTLLRSGNLIDISELWHSHTHLHSSQSLFSKIQEANIDPVKKRLSLQADFPEMNEEKLKDETNVLRLNRLIYDFFLSISAEPWLKQYFSFVEKYFLVCRAIKIIPDGSEILYPFMKVEALISRLQSLEGSYFNPRKLPEITDLIFNNGTQV